MSGKSCWQGKAKRLIERLPEVESNAWHSARLRANGAVYLV